MITRKDFIKQLGALVSLSLIPDFVLSNSILGDNNASASTYKVFDLHCHPGAFFRKGSPSYAGDDNFKKVINDMNANHINGVFLSIVSDLNLIKVTEKGVKPVRSFEEGEAWQSFEQQLSIIQELIALSDTSIINSVKELDKSKKVAVFISCEGSDFVDGDIDNINRVFELGVRSVQLVHYAPNTVGDLQTESPINDGLSAYGKDIVKRMNEVGMLIDVAHASFKTVTDVAEITSTPIMLSHSILKKETNDPVNARAITKEHAKIVAETGGIIGAWPSGLNTDMDDFVAATIELADVVGIDHVALGTDMDANYKPVIKDYFDVQKWVAALEVKGLSKTEIDKLTIANAKRVLKKTLK